MKKFKPTFNPSLLPELAETLTSFGGHLECNECGRVEPIRSVRQRLTGGWPECHGQTMIWVTARQAEAREKER